MNLMFQLGALPCAEYKIRRVGIASEYAAILGHLWIDVFKERDGRWTVRGSEETVVTVSR